MQKALADIFDCPSDNEDFLGFGVDSPEGFSEESQDSLHSRTSWKPVLRFRSKFITDELAHIFMDSDSEGEFEGFSKAESSLRSSWMSPVALESEEDSDDIGFYSDDADDNPALQRRQSSGLCVAFRFPTRSTHERHVPKKSSEVAEVAPLKRAPEERPRMNPGRTRERPAVGSSESEEESELTEAELQILNKRAKNIQENKDMLAKLFADLTSTPEFSPKTTPTKKRKTHTIQKPKSQSKRRNPGRKARPPKHFGREEVPIKSSQLKKKTFSIDLQKLMVIRQDEVKYIGQRARKKRVAILMPEDITKELLDNVADRAKDKILDKNYGSTCHQCRQKTLDTKTECRSSYCHGLKGQFCGPCLRNRYGEDVRTALLDPTWTCPLCRGVCNCSLCRKRDGRCATGVLTHLAKYCGYGSVKGYLERTTPCETRLVESVVGCVVFGRLAWSSDLRSPYPYSDPAEMTSSQIRLVTACGRHAVRRSCSLRRRSVLVQYT
ncbi:cell division cycle-associated 7-like protein isoform X2 [Brachyhypopomus gauderio]|uniref:cell division cycle-associated 7-like protein isoform X2 n=1 Tax=Brachyhypopomus gauderio TaxID=698409 RepID=UPI0040423AB1